MSGTGDIITAALAPLTARQEQFKQTMDGRIEKIYNDVSNIASLISAASASSTVSPNSNHAVSEEQLSPTQSRSSVSSFSSIRSCPTILSTAEICSASRTLGFFPFKLDDLKNNSNESITEATLTASLDVFFRDHLLLGSKDLSRIEVKNIWFNHRKNMIFAEFFSMQMCYSIFKHMTNLRGIQRVEKFRTEQERHWKTVSTSDPLPASTENSDSNDSSACTMLDSTLKSARDLKDHIETIHASVNIAMKYFQTEPIYKTMLHLCMWQEI